MLITGKVKRDTDLFDWLKNEEYVIPSETEYYNYSVIYVKTEKTELENELISFSYICVDRELTAQELSNVDTWAESFGTYEEIEWY